MLSLTRTSLTALALIASAAAVSQTSAAANRGCKDTGAPSALSALLKASTSRTAVMAPRTPTGRVVAKPCDDKKTAVQKAPAKLQAKPAQPTRLKVKLKKKIGKKTLTAAPAPTGPKKPGGKLGVIDNGDGGERIPGAPADGFAVEPGGDGTPFFALTPGQTAYVQLVHGSCLGGEPDCMKHVLANENGNVTAHGTLTAHCPAGQTVTRLEAANHGEVGENLIVGPPQQSYSVQVNVKFIVPESIEGTANLAHGGNWNGGPNDDPSPSENVQSWVAGWIELTAECDNYLVEKVDYLVKIPATFHNLDYTHVIGTGGAQAKDLGN